jgi:hypothetical protein
MVIYYSGTGNSRYAAQLIARRLGDELIDAGIYESRAQGGAEVRKALGVRVPHLRLAHPQNIRGLYKRRPLQWARAGVFRHDLRRRDRRLRTSG